MNQNYEKLYPAYKPYNHYVRWCGQYCGCILFHTYKDKSKLWNLALHNNHALYFIASVIASESIIFMLNMISFLCSQSSHTTASHTDHQAKVGLFLLSVPLCCQKCLIQFAGSTRISPNHKQQHFQICTLCKLALK